MHTYEQLNNNNVDILRQKPHCANLTPRRQRPQQKNARHREAIGPSAQENLDENMRHKILPHFL